ncbi:CXADR-like membrane protein isoform X2 [Eleutherodactylus coqui]|uniref:CXADR-like membrane protein isoform X2 n=1 Tax=Eleutherodactylus coqui TaxID=57060 RepID=UPI0034617F9B
MGLPEYLQRFPLQTAVLILSLFCCSLGGKLEIRRIDSPVKALLDKIGVIPCHFFGYEPSVLDQSMISVGWTVSTSQNTEKRVYLFDGKIHNASRSGSYIPDDGLVGGDASLHIPNLQFSDEGKYTCTVIITPDKAISKVTLEVSAKPVCAVSDPTLVMNPDTEKSAKCYVTGFHPEKVTIQWLKASKASSDISDLDSRTCTSVAVQNKDGTYNVTSVLSVTPMSLDEDGDVYSCVISHRSLKDAFMVNVTLSVQPRGHSTIPWIILGLVLMAVICLITAAIMYKVKPRVSEITAKDLLHMTENTLNCQISGFRPKNLTINVYLEKDVGVKSEETSWSSGKPKRTESQSTDTEQAVPLQTRNDSGNLRLDPVITSYMHSYLFNCDCAIHITPEFQIHNRAALNLEVHHAALKSPIRRYQILKVKSIPKLDPIQSNQESYGVGDQLELTCRIHSCYPKSLQVLWYKDIEEIPSQNTEETRDENGLYPLTSSVNLCTITKEDFGKTFRCKVKYPSGTTPRVVQWKLEMLGKIKENKVDVGSAEDHVGSAEENCCSTSLPYRDGIKGRSLLLGEENVKL